LAAPLYVTADWPTVASVDVREARHAMLVLPVVRREDDHLVPVDIREHLDTGARAGAFGDVLAAVEIVQVALDQVAAVLRDIGNRRIQGDLIKTLDRRFADIVRANAVQLRGDLFLRHL